MTRENKYSIVIRKAIPKPYSYDLRKKVMQTIESGKSVVEISKIFNISRKVIYDWKNLEKETGDFQLKTGYQKGHSHRITDLKEFQKFLYENQDKTSVELAALYPKTIAASTIRRMIRKINYSYKKNFFASKKK